MKNSLGSVIAVLGLVLLNSGCGATSSGNDSYKAQQERDQKAQSDKYSRVAGVYDGNGTFGQKTFASKLIVYQTQITAGTNPDGSAKTLSVLCGRFQVNDVVPDTDYVTMKGDYSELGHLTLSSTGASDCGAGVTATSTISVDGTVINSQASGLRITKNGGTWGYFTGSLTSTNTDSPGGGDGIDRRNRLLSLYSKLEGSYVGIQDDGVERHPIEIVMTIGQGPTGGVYSGVPQPELVALYRRTDLPAGTVERQLRVTYDAISDSIAMEGLASTGSGTVPGSSYFSVGGTWINGTLKVTIADRRGNLGNFQATRKTIN